MKLTDLRLVFVCVNLARRADRWREVLREFRRHGLEVLRQPGVDASRVKDPRGFQNERRYACSLAKRLAIRRGFHAGAEAVVLLEDDVVLHPDFAQRLAEIELPEDWSMFFLGGRHLQRPIPIGKNLVRVTQAADNHALVVRRESYWQVMHGLAGGRKGDAKHIPYSDVKLSLIQAVVPTYAVYPNLAWQRASYSETDLRLINHYRQDGRQSSPVAPVSGLEEELAGLPARAASPAMTAPEPPGEASQLRSPESQHTQPDWSWSDNEVPRHCLEDTFQLMRYLNLARREDRRNECEYQLITQGLRGERFPAVDARTVRKVRGHKGPGQYACALSHRLMLRDAAMRRAPAVLIFEDDIEFLPDFRRLAESIPLPEDWGIFYYGCIHVKPPEVIAPGLVRVRGAFATHAYAVRENYYHKVRRAMRTGLPGIGIRECDVVLSELAAEIPTYAVYPNLVRQAEGESDIMHMRRGQYASDGRQRYAEDRLRSADEAMIECIRDYLGPRHANDSHQPLQ